jgi:hypothetical protein
MSMTPSERSMRSRIAAYTLHSTHDSRVLTAPARAAFMSSFERQVDPDRVLSEGERRRRADQARKAHMTRLAYRSARARSRRAKKITQ